MSHETDLELLHASSKSTANAYRHVDILPYSIDYCGAEMPIKALECCIPKETMNSYYDRRWAIGRKAIGLIQQRDNADNEWAEKDRELKELQLQVERLKDEKRSIELRQANIKPIFDRTCVPLAEETSRVWRPFMLELSSRVCQLPRELRDMIYAELT